MSQSRSFQAGPFDDAGEALAWRTAIAREAARNNETLTVEESEQAGRLYARATLTRVAAVPAPPTHPIGALSRRYEVGDRGPGAVSTGRGDYGSVSYGSYQMTSAPAGGTVARFVAEPGFAFAHRFAGRAPSSPGFTAAWRALAAEAPAAFAAAQHDFIRRTHHEPLLRGVRTRTGVDLSGRCAALADVLWSTAVQHGPGTRVVDAALAAAGPGATDRALIEAIYAERGRRRPDGALAHFSKNSEPVQRSVAARFVAECRDALTMLA